MASKQLQAIQKEINQINQKAKKLKIKQPSFDTLVVNSVNQIYSAKNTLDIAAKEVANELKNITNKAFPEFKKINALITSSQSEVPNQQEPLTKGKNDIIDNLTQKMDDVYSKFINEDIQSTILLLKSARKNCLKYSKTTHFNLIKSEKTELNTQKKNLSLKIIKYIDYLIVKYSNANRTISKMIKKYLDNANKTSWKDVKSNTNFLGTIYTNLFYE